MDVNSQEKVCTVPISLIDDFAEHPFQVRDDEDMERLVQSIDNNGVLNPVILRKNGERYELMNLKNDKKREVKANEDNRKNDAR